MRISSLLPVATALAISSLAFGQTFNNCTGSPATPPCNDTTTSLGTFIINVSPSFQPFFTGVPGYDPVSGIFVSPLLSDPNTVIGRSAPFTNTGNPVTGVTIGTGPNALTNQSTPGTLPPGFSQTAGNDTILTALLNMSLSGGGITVDAGASAPAGTPNSIGEVQANQNSMDFPATSFFDVFVDVSIPMLGGFSNTTPLLVEGMNLMALPPTVVYTHGGSLSPVPIMGDATNSMFAGDTLGTFALAGHGVNFNTTPMSEEQFVEDFEADVNGDSSLTPEEQSFIDNSLNADVPEPATWVTLAVGLGLVLASRKLRKA